METRVWKTIREFEEILFEEYNGIAKITINRPRYRNAFTPKTTWELSQAFSMCREMQDISVVLLTGAGDKAFCSGGDMHVNASAEDAVTIPLSLMQRTFNMGQDIDLIAITARRGVAISDITPKIREVVARAHDIDPTDEKAVMVFNTEVLFGLLDNLFNGVDILIWLVGIGTLLAGAIGVSNIMMVTVKERTTEIGIRRAIGATPRMILKQIISESILLTAVAGMSGIIFAVFVLQGMEMGFTEDGVPKGHFQVTFWAAIAAAAVLAVLGVLAGLAPAARAMSIKPVDAMREE